MRRRLLPSLPPADQTSSGPGGPAFPAPKTAREGGPSTSTLLERIRADWQLVRPGLDPSPMLTYLLLARLQAALERQIARTYLPSGLNSATWDLLITLRRSAPPEGLTPTELSQLTAISGASMTNRVGRLLSKGLVEREVSERDRRSSRVRLSARGLALADELLPPHLENETAVFSLLDPAEVATLEALAGKLLGRLEAAGLAADLEHGAELE